MKTNFFKIRFLKDRMVLATRHSIISTKSDDMLVITTDKDVDKKVILTSGGSHHHVVFDNSAEATIFVDEISSRLLRHVFFRQISNTLFNLLKIVSLITLIMFVLNLNATIFLLSQTFSGDVPFSDVKTPFKFNRPSPNVESPHLESSFSTSAPHLTSGEKSEEVAKQASSEMIARTLKRGVITGDYSVDLGKGGGPDVYVFSDPLCPHCRDAEQLFEDLANEGLNVHVFPVTVITEGYRSGRPDLYEKTLKEVKSLLCNRDEQRSKNWLQLMTRTPALTATKQEPLQSCAAGNIALSTNNDMYHAIGLQGTPALINANGDIFSPEDVLSVPAVKKWASVK